MSVTTQLAPQLAKPSTSTNTNSTTPAFKPSFAISKQQPDLKSPAFTRWRPTYHLIAPHSWLNDPCGPGYDPSTGKYHLAFQWNPKDNDWGDISWGRATSHDLISWEVDADPCLVPHAPYDSKGIFTGCFQPTNINGQADGTLMYIYTSASKLPIHYTLPYTPGCETLSVALSRDAGRTWERHPHNPILDRPPPDIQVTGWRDPYLFSWSSAPAAVRTRAQDAAASEDIMYGFISGGIVGKTPTIFVYAVPRNELGKWTYIGSLLDVGLNMAPSRWTGDFGVNWEVTNLVTLRDDEGVSRDFLIMGVEGCIPESNNSKDRDRKAVARDRRIQRSQLWMCIKNSADRSSSALMQYAYGGIFDSGLFYAANSFWDPVAQQQVLFGWITEEDLPDDIRKEQGWSGLISLPRVMKLQTMHRVKRARITDLKDITSIEVTPDDRGSYTVRTLGVTPDPRGMKLREGAKESKLCDLVLEDKNGEYMNDHLELNTARWEIDAEISVGKTCTRVGLEIHHENYKTVLFWDPESETFQIHRPDIQNTHRGINHDPETSPHTLFTYISSQGTNDEEVEETLRIRALFDASVLEVFVNERTAISTRIYNASETNCPASTRIRFFAESALSEGNDTVAKLLHATAWDGLGVEARQP
ncbi:hypothetical protein ASPVEDRAFT_44399 [Aspergillus versicolor CBS 583.65]|uniref:Glycosyl hydrolase family 32 N-terminal domain-containing protein n=1 Tax=Aspergillus versicolor CBS 583.65 TaxID=1036611 RepID=A0A1L9PTV4_ASPVE|nr:uncharacterized protein ASPVEDRAFT_44399 [Aspergillus versicolor CBS 583.65]OJJ04855.1 hypothetical protein ASPVEDRAFT_44399 [Aspergillus versicolor CBS 583.65]